MYNSTVSIPSTSPGTLPPLMSLFWTLISVLTMVISTPLSTSNPPTPNNTSITLAVIPHQPNAPSLTPLPLEGVVSVTIPMISTLIPQTSPEPSLPGSTQSLSLINSYSVVSITLTPPTPLETPTTSLSSPFTIFAFTISNRSSGKVSISTPLGLPYVWFFLDRVRNCVRAEFFEFAKCL